MDYGIRLWSLPGGWIPTISKFGNVYDRFMMIDWHRLAHIMKLGFIPDHRMSKMRATEIWGEMIKGSVAGSIVSEEKTVCWNGSHGHIKIDILSWALSHFGRRFTPKMYYFIHVYPQKSKHFIISRSNQTWLAGKFTLSFPAINLH